MIYNFLLFRDLIDSQWTREALWLTETVCLLMMQLHLLSRYISICLSEQSWTQNWWAVVIDVYSWEKWPRATELAWCNVAHRYSCITRAEGEEEHWCSRFRGLHIHINISESGLSLHVFHPSFIKVINQWNTLLTECIIHSGFVEI